MNVQSIIPSILTDAFRYKIFNCKTCGKKDNELQTDK